MMFSCLSSKRVNVLSPVVPSCVPPQPQQKAEEMNEIEKEELHLLALRRALVIVCERKLNFQNQPRKGLFRRFLSRSRREFGDEELVKEEIVRVEKILQQLKNELKNYPEISCEAEKRDINTESTDSESVKTSEDCSSSSSDEVVDSELEQELLPSPPPLRLPVTDVKVVVIEPIKTEAESTRNQLETLRRLAEEDAKETDEEDDDNNDDWLDDYSDHKCEEITNSIQAKAKVEKIRSVPTSVILEITARTLLTKCSFVPQSSSTTSSTTENEDEEWA